VGVLNDVLRLLRLRGQAVSPRTDSTEILNAVLQELKEIRSEVVLFRQEVLRISSPEIVASSSVNLAPPHIYPDEAPLTNHPHPDNVQSDLAGEVRTWLERCGITIRSCRQPSEDDETLNRLAHFLGDRFGHLAELYELIKQNLSDGKKFSFTLWSSVPKKISDCTQFCTLLKTHGFLSSYQYVRAGRKIYAAPSRKGNAINFLSGAWFERFVHLRIRKLLLNHEQKFENMANTIISLSSQDDFELDLLYWVEGKPSPLWIECKTGDYKDSLDKYSKFRKTLNVPKQNAILVVLGISDERASHLTNSHDITIVNEQALLKIVAQSLGFSNNK
jgi:hypothetical protein